MSLQKAILSDNPLLLIIRSLLGGYFSNNQQAAWDKYTYNRDYGTTNTFIKQQINSIASGILGPQLGPFVADLMSISVPNDFRTGGLSSFGTNLISSKGQTFSNNLMNFTDAAYRYKNSDNLNNIRRSLNRSFYHAYYDLTMQGRPKAEIDTAVNNAMNSLPFSLPFWAKTLVDPTQILKTLSNISGALKDLILRLRIIDPLGVSSVKKAKALGTSILEMVSDANSRSLGQSTRDGKKIASYGGFTGSAVSLLSKILAEATQVLEGTADEGKIKESLLHFQNTVKKTTKALMPLKDIFGQDVKAMVTTLLSITGQSIGNLSQLSIQRVSRLIVLTMRKNPLLSAGDIVKSSTALKALGAQAGLSQVGIVTMGKAGVRFSNFIKDANLAPWGMTNDYFRGQVGKDIISAEGSLDKLLVSQAYAVWKLKNKDGTLLQFKNMLQQSMRRGLTTDDFIFRTLNLGVKNRVDLQERALSSGYYKEARRLDFSDIASYAQAQTYIKLQKRLASSNIHLKGADLDKVLNILLNSSSSDLRALMSAVSYLGLSKQQQELIGSKHNFRALQYMTQGNLKVRQIVTYAAKSKELRLAKELAQFLSSVFNGEDGGGYTSLSDIYKQLTGRTGDTPIDRAAKRLKLRFDKVIGGEGTRTALDYILKNHPLAAATYLLMFRTGLQEGILGDTEFQTRFQLAVKIRGGFKTGNKDLADAKLITYVMSKGNKTQLDALLEDWFKKNKNGTITGLSDKGKLRYKWYQNRIKGIKGERSSITLQLQAQVSRLLAEREAAIDAADKWAQTLNTLLKKKYEDLDTLLRLALYSNKSKRGKQVNALYLSKFIKKDKNESLALFSIRKQSLIDMSAAKRLFKNTSKASLQLKEVAMSRFLTELGTEAFNKIQSHLDLGKDIDLKKINKDLPGLSKEKLQRLSYMHKQYKERLNTKTDADLQQVEDLFKDAKHAPSYISFRNKGLGKDSSMNVTGGSASGLEGLLATLQNLTKVLNSLFGWLSSQRAQGSN